MFFKLGYLSPRVCLLGIFFYTLLWSVLKYLCYFRSKVFLRVQCLNFFLLLIICVSKILFYDNEVICLALKSRNSFTGYRRPEALKYQGYKIHIKMKHVTLSHRKIIIIHI